MTEDRDLLPWILGTLSVAAVAMAIAIGVTGRTTSAHASSQTPSSPAALATAELNPQMQNSATPAGSAPAAAGPTSTAPASSTASSSTAQAYPEPASAQGVGAAQGIGAAQAQPALAPNAAGNQIWECTTGVKTFSSNRCGNSAVLREVGPINVMDASPASNVHWYGAGPGAEPNDASDYYDPGPQQPADNSYPAVIGIPYLERRRPDHPRQPNKHDRGHPHGN